MGDHLVLVGEGPVEVDAFGPVGGVESGVIADEQGAEQGGHQGRRQPRRADRHATEHAEGEGHEVVGDLLLVELRGPESDDRQHAEQAEAETGGDVARREGLGDRQHADVDGEVGDDQVATPMAGEVEAEGEDADRHQVEGERE